jgi:hypothetical protein
VDLENVFTTTKLIKLMMPARRTTFPNLPQEIRQRILVKAIRKINCYSLLLSNLLKMFLVYTVYSLPLEPGARLKTLETLLSNSNLNVWKYWRRSTVEGAWGEWARILVLRRRRHGHYFARAP